MRNSLCTAACGGRKRLREVNMIDEKLLAILACPVCKTDVKLEDDRIVCVKCGRRYPIREGGIPVMLVDEAEMPSGEQTETNQQGDR